MAEVTMLTDAKLKSSLSDYVGLAIRDGHYIDKVSYNGTPFHDYTLVSTLDSRVKILLKTTETTDFSEEAHCALRVIKPVFYFENGNPHQGELETSPLYQADGQSGRWYYKKEDAFTIFKKTQERRIIKNIPEFAHTFWVDKDKAVSFLRKRNSYDYAFRLALLERVPIYKYIDYDGFIRYTIDWDLL